MWKRYPFPKKHLDKVLPQNVDPKSVYTGTKLSLTFQIKDKSKKQHKHDLIYHTKRPECDESYVGETGGRLQDRFDEYSGKDSKSNILRHSYQDNHKMCPEIISKFLEMDARRI